MSRFKIGKANTWEGQASGRFFRDNNRSKNKISISYTDLGNHYYDICVKIESLSYRSDRLVDYGELFVGIAERNKTSFSTTVKKGYQAREGASKDYRFYRSDYMRLYTQFFFKVIRGKNEYHFKWWITGSESYQIQRDIDYAVLHYNITPYIKMHARLFRIKHKKEGEGYVENPLLDKRVTLDNLCYRWKYIEDNLGMAAHVIPCCAIAVSKRISLYL